MKYWICLILSAGNMHACLIPGKALICGIAKNIEPALNNTMVSATALGELFDDYRIIIYENNSTDRTPQLLHAWAGRCEKVVVRSEILRQWGPTSLYRRIESISNARNKVLDIAMSSAYDDYTYLIWADLDFIDPWDVCTVAETILEPQHEWDAVFANGAYDLFAFRDETFPIGFELIGNHYWHVLNEVRAQFYLHPTEWRRVYSAFGGLGIYKKDALKGCRYSAAITPSLENYILQWLTAPSLSSVTCLFNHYLNLHHAHLETEYLRALKQCDTHEMQQVLFFSDGGGMHPPFTCEHINFHAEMAARGRNKLFLNPRLISNHP